MYRWDRRSLLGDRYGQAYQVLAWGNRGSAIIQFTDGARYLVGASTAKRL